MALSAAAFWLLSPEGISTARTIGSAELVPAFQDGLKGVVTDMVTGEPLI